MEQMKKVISKRKNKIINYSQTEQNDIKNMSDIQKLKYFHKQKQQGRSVKELQQVSKKSRATTYRWCSGKEPKGRGRKTLLNDQERLRLLYEFLYKQPGYEFPSAKKVFITFLKDQINSGQIKDNITKKYDERKRVYSLYSILTREYNNFYNQHNDQYQVEFLDILQQLIISEFEFSLKKADSEPEIETIILKDEKDENKQQFTLSEFLLKFKPTDQDFFNNEEINNQEPLYHQNDYYQNQYHQLENDSSLQQHQSSSDSNQQYSDEYKYEEDQFTNYLRTSEEYLPYQAYQGSFSEYQ